MFFAELFIGNKGFQRQVSVSAHTSHLILVLKEEIYILVRITYFCSTLSAAVGLMCFYRDRRGVGGGLVCVGSFSSLWFLPSPGCRDLRVR